LKVRFQADNDLRSAIRRDALRREHAIDFRAAREIGLDYIPDS
jgi:hypothetical protein